HHKRRKETRDLRMLEALNCVRHEGIPPTVVGTHNAAVQRRRTDRWSARCVHNEMTHTRRAALPVGPSAATACYAARASRSLPSRYPKNISSSLVPQKSGNVKDTHVIGRNAEVASDRR